VYLFKRLIIHQQLKEMDKQNFYYNIESPCDANNVHKSKLVHQRRYFSFLSPRAARIRFFIICGAGAAFKLLRLPTDMQPSLNYICLFRLIVRHKSDPLLITALSVRCRADSGLLSKWFTRLSAAAGLLMLN
jgi:hypothetical protein